MLLCICACEHACVCGKTREIWRILLYSKTIFGDRMCLRKMGPTVAEKHRVIINYYNLSITTHSLSITTHFLRCACLFLSPQTCTVNIRIFARKFVCTLEIHSFRHYLDFTVSSFGKAMYCLHMWGRRQKNKIKSCSEHKGRSRYVWKEDCSTNKRFWDFLFCNFLLVTRFTQCKIHETTLSASRTIKERKKVLTI